MKRFDIITETDARTLEIGSIVTLARGGHVTPLAADTLRARRITIVGDDRGEGGIDLTPVAEIRRVIIGSDHTGLALKNILVQHLRARGLAVDDVGTHTADAVDYPDIALRVASGVATHEADAGIVIDGAGLGSAIAANKVDGVRAAMCTDPTLARYSREHNGANVLALGSTLVTRDAALTIVDTWLHTAMKEPRYIRRLAKIRAIERNR
jgi:ribose 5-phosphate isomerase B